MFSPLADASLAFLFGLLIGSFLNVVIHRLPRDLSVVTPRSQCPKCGHPIAWYDNIPLLSFVLLGGKCRHCGERISWRYPAVEFMTGALFFNFVYSSDGVTLPAIKMCVFSALLVGLLFTDLEERILPDELTKGGMALGFLFALIVPVPSNIAQPLLEMLFRINLTGTAASILEAAFGAAVPAFFLWAAGAIYEKIRHKEGLGFGDVKLIAMVGAFFGLQGAVLIWLLGSISGSILGYGYVKATGKDVSTYELPFGTFLCASALIVAVFEKPMLGG
jgi:leader peptidase (prepilin peptidase) / N-methyltransferase